MSDPTSMTDTIRPYWIVRRVDETQYWTIDKKDKQYVDKIIGVYYFNRNSHTYCCELTPSYWMIWHSDVIYFKDLPEDDRQADEIRCRLAETYEQSSHDDNSCYVHVREVERAMQEHPENFHRYGYIHEDCEDHGEGEVHEWVNGNNPFA